MKKILSASVLAVLLFTGQAHAQIGFLLGLGAGAVLFGGDSTNNSAGSASILYTMEDASVRVKDKLLVRQGSGKFCFEDFKDADQDWKRAKGFSFVQLFRYIVKDSDRYELLQVVRVIVPERVDCAAIWVAYTEKSNVSPPKPEQKHKK